MTETIERSTTMGTVRGIVRLGVETYLGLRYAQPAKRFEPPSQAIAWTGVFDATTLKPMPPQSRVLECIYGPMPKVGFDEDCLYLNLHVPAQSAANPRPVLVFIHGGSHMSGAANFYDGTALALGADAVVACINYRLGIFGAVDRTRFGSFDEGGGQLWLEDQIAALRWVRQNIADYGGDPSRVTIIGESAGAQSVIALCAAPSAEGLVHGAVACSAGNLVMDPPNDIVGKVARIRRVSRAAAMAYLDSAPMGELLALQRRHAGSIAPNNGAGTFLLPGSIEKLIQERGASAVPLIVGYATHEGDCLDHLIKVETGLPWPLLDLIRTIGARMIARMPAGGKGRVPAYLKRLRKVKKSIGFGPRFNDLVWTDLFRRAAINYAEATSSAGSRGYVYVMDVPTEIDGQRMRSTHGVDLALTFNPYADPAHTVPRFAAHPAAAELAQRWIAMLGQFARTGEPGADFGPWPAYEAGQRASMHIAADSWKLDYDVDSEYRLHVWQ